MSNTRPRLVTLNQFADLARQLRAELIMTADFVAIDERASAGRALKMLDSNHFDQLPVQRNGVVVGLVRLSQVQHAAPGSSIAELSEQLSHENSVELTTTFPSLFRKLETVESCLVTDDEEAVVGLIHYSDLNRQAVRYYLYLLLSAVEQGIAEIIQSSYPDDSWVRGLPDKGQAKLKSEYESAKARNVELSYLDLAYFRHLAQAVIADGKLGRHLNLTESEKDLLGTLNELRNLTMHPVKLLVKSRADIQSLRTRSQFLRALLRRLTARLGNPEAI